MIFRRGHKYVVASLSQDNSYNAVLCWDIHEVIEGDTDGVEDGKHIPRKLYGTNKVILDVTNAMPIRPCADGVLGLMELETSGYTCPGSEDGYGDDAPMVEYCKKHNFDAMIEYCIPYENMTQEGHYPNVGPRKYGCLYTFRPGL